MSDPKTARDCLKGPRFPTCRHCRGISSSSRTVAKHVGEIDHLEEAHAPAGFLPPSWRAP